MSAEARQFSAPWVLALIGLTLLPAALLWPYRHAGFVADDIFFGPGFRIHSWLDALLGPWPHGFGAAKAWRPLVVLSYAVNGPLSDGQPDGYRLLNYLVHGLNAALLAVLTRQLAGRRAVGVLAGVLFAVHPMVHENVLWISGRTYPFAAVFALALCVWTVGAPRRSAWRQHLVGVPLLVGALASYEFGIVIPIALAGLALVAWPRERVSWRGLALFLAPYVATLCVYLLFRWVWLSGFSSDFIVAARASRWVPAPPILYRLPRNVLFFVLRLLAWPPFTRGSDIALDATGAATTIAVVVSLIVVLRDPSRRAQGWWWLGWIALWFAPVAAFAGFSDRFGYLSVAGLAALLATAAGAALASGRAVASARRVTARGLGAAAGIGVVALLWTAGLRAHGRDWVEAGRLAQRVVDQAVALEPPPTAPVTLHYFDVPRQHRASWVFITYFPMAVLARYPEAARHFPTFHLSWEPYEPELARIRATPGDGPVRVYRWNTATESFELLWSRPAPARPLPGG